MRNQEHNRSVCITTSISVIYIETIHVSLSARGQVSPAYLSNIELLIADTLPKHSKTYKTGRPKFLPKRPKIQQSRVMRNKDNRLNNLTVRIHYRYLIIFYLSKVRSSQYKNQKGWILKLFGWRNTSRDPIFKVRVI